ncbi:3,4-dihydroxy-2-butanone-4-phosphate synthase [Mycobacterium sp. DL440]|uniref:3,4-dihydroxy-2-butanone-4-phosphate synthase n=1 Tax=Mycobacterium sp. DL440 TaxID=2675523 RepID=UPI001420716B|nr:3,4-dihydroxy-2-butanone-4-phosphate synthase [Mycobacterium sp. DL440]
MLGQLNVRPPGSAVGGRRRKVECDMALSSVAEGLPLVVASPRGCDLMVLAARATTASIAFLVRHGSGFVTVAMTADRLAALGLPSQRARDGGRHRPALHVAVDAVAGTTTGISAHDRALTIRLLGDPGSTPGDFLRPGHVIPVRADFESNLPPGVPETAAMIGLIAADAPATAICSLVVDADPTGIASAQQGRQFAETHGIGFVHSGDITHLFYRDRAMRDVHGM